MLFGIDPASSAAYRRARQEYLAQADESMAKLRQYAEQYNLGFDATRIRELDASLASLKSLFSMTGDLGESQMTQANLEIAQLQHANTSTLWTLWIATILGAIIGGVISFLLSRRITCSIDLVGERADASAEGDLTGKELNHLYRSDQIGTLAKAMQKMQSNLSSIIGTVVDTAGSLTGSAASMRSRPQRPRATPRRQHARAATSSSRCSVRCTPSPPPSARPRQPSGC